MSVVDFGVVHHKNVSDGIAVRASLHAPLQMNDKLHASTFTTIFTTAGDEMFLRPMENTQTKFAKHQHLLDLPRAGANKVCDATID